MKHPHDSRPRPRLGTTATAPANGPDTSSGPSSPPAASRPPFLPERERHALRSAIRLEWTTVGTQAVIVGLVALVAGQSQAMKVAWIEDALSTLPPAAFLIATRRIRRPPDAEHPYGFHRSIGVAHLVAASALFAVGAYLAIDSAMSLVKLERPPVGITPLFGHAVWAGWLMIIVMVITTIPPIILGRLKMRLAEPLHDKVLYADADMSKANWTSATATIVGVLGIGIGWWWADSVAALAVSVSIMRDGVHNIRAAVLGLTDTRARTFDDREPHPLLAKIDAVVERTDWVNRSSSRVRDEGHLFHVEVFVVPEPDRPLTPAACQDLVTRLRELDWKIHDVVIAPLPDLPEGQAFPPETPSDA